MYAPCFSRPDRLALSVALALGGAAVHADCYVTVANDDGTGAAGTLSWAILTANGTSNDGGLTHPGGGCTGNTITLNTDVTITGVMQRLIDSNLTLQSDATTRTINGRWAYRPLFVKSGTVTIRNLTVTNGKALGGGGNFGGGGAGLGGALFVYRGAVTVENVSFTGNVAQGGGWNGDGGVNGGGGMLGASYDGGGGLFGGATSRNGGYGGTGAYGGRGGTSANKPGGFGGGGFGSLASGAGGGAGGFGGGGGYGAYISGGNGGFGSGGGYGNNANGGGGGFGGGGGGTSASTVGAGGFGGASGSGTGGGGGAGLGGAIFVKQGALSLKSVSFSGNSAIRGTGANNGQGKGGAVFICTSDLDSDNTAAGAKGGCSGTIDATSSYGVTLIGNTAADGQPGVFWTQMPADVQACGFGVGFPIGQWQMLAAPCVPAGAGTVATTFGNFATDGVNLKSADYATSWLLYSVNPAANAYVAESSANLVAPGTGYWIKTLTAAVNDQLVVLNGTATPAPVLAADGCASANGCQAVTVSTVSGASRYNLVGNPFPYNVDWAKVRVRINGAATTYTPSQAAGVAASGNASTPVLAKEIWIWNGTAYDPYDDSTLGMIGNLRYFQSFWVKVLPGAFGKTVELLIPAEQTTHAQTAPSRPWYRGVLDWLLPSAAAATLPAVPDWYVRLKVDNPATGWKDHSTVIGQRQRALPGYDPADLVELAPFAAPYLTMVLPHPEWGAKAGDYASDLRPADGKATAWTLEVRADPVGSQVVLRWEGDQAILQRSQLLDSQTGRTIVPTDPNYRDGYPVTLTGKTHRFVWRYLGR